MPHLQAFLRLIRWDKPIGTFLLLWPTYWALWLASNGAPTLAWFCIFTAGAVIMRSAGCIINDLADKRFDGQVARTKHRPLVKGELTPQQAWYAFIALLFLALGLLIPMNPLSWAIAVVAVILSSVYPFMKRHTHYPQVVLGLAWSLSGPLAFSAIQGALPFSVWVLYGAVVFWTIAFDAYYALSDWIDDQKVGICSIATRFGDQTPIVALLCHLIAFGFLAGIGYCFALGGGYFAAWGMSLIIALTQYYRVQQVIDKPAVLPGVAFHCFLENRWIGCILWLGLVFDFWLK